MKRNPSPQKAKQELFQVSSESYDDYNARRPAHPERIAVYVARDGVEQRPALVGIERLDELMSKAKLQFAPE